MRRILIILTLALAAPLLPAQRHGGRSSPPTAPFVAPIPPPQPLVAVSSGLGAIQFTQVNYGVPAPQALTRQLRFDDDRTRAAALSAIGAPSQYLQRGHIPIPRSVDLAMVAISNSDDLDALITVELDQHIVTAVLVPVDGNWRRIASLIYATPFGDTSTTPSTWLATARSFIQKDRYRAIFHASTGSLDGNFTENEAQLRIINNRPVITLSFESTERECAAPPTTRSAAPTPQPALRPGRSTIKSGCNIAQRWFQTDPTDPVHRFELITGSAHLNPKDLEDRLTASRIGLSARLRNFSCQPFTFSESSQRYEPAGPNGLCKLK